ncbi:MAG: polysaccharide biosynthesis protein [Firmicutes bacterium]|nr:polysaccharide biosynthesis protein [Bacillota bacterium]
MNIVKKNELGNDAIRLTSSKIVTMIISMIMAMLLSRFRTLEEYGTYSQILLVVNLSTNLLMLGLPNSINYFLSQAESEEEKNRFLSVYYILSTVLSFAIGIVLILSSSYIVKYFNNKSIETYLYFLALYPWSKIILSSIENVLIVCKKVNTLFLFRIANSISLLSIIIIVEFFQLGFSCYMALFILVESIFSILVYFISLNIYDRCKIVLDFEIIKRILKFSIPIGLASVVGMINIQLDKLIIGKFFTVEEVAIYTNAAKELPITIVATSLTAIIMPEIVKLLKKDKVIDAINLWGNSIVIAFSIISLFSFGLFVFADEVIQILYSSKYLPGATVFRIYNLVLLIRVTYFGIMLNSQGKTKLIFYSSLVSLIMNIILNYSFYNLLGFIGPAIATFVSLLVIAGFQLFMTSISLKLSIINIFPWRDLLKFILTNIVLGSIFGCTKHLISMYYAINNISLALTLGFLWAIIYFFITRRIIIKNWNAIGAAEF